MKRNTYYRGVSGKKYGIWNDVAKRFQFGICEDTPMLAEARLFQKLGDDARKWRFQPRMLPDAEIERMKELSQGADYVMEHLMHTIRSGYEKYLQSVFETHGYSKAEIFDLERSCRIRREKQGVIDTYLLDDEPIFRIKTSVVIGDKVEVEYAEIPLE